MAGGISSEELARLTAAGVWKGENESDAELTEGVEGNPLADAGAWTEDEAYRVYRDKLVHLRDLYTGQLGHLKHVLREQRREFLLQWLGEGGGKVHASQPSQGGTREDAAYRCYRQRSGEEAVLQRKRKIQRINTSLEFYSKRELKESNKAHHHYLTKLLQQQATPTATPCSNPSCDHPCLPFATRCSRHMLEDGRQLLYVRCCYVYPTGLQCSNPVVQYMETPLCGGHCDNIELNPEGEIESDPLQDSTDDSIAEPSCDNTEQKPDPPPPGGQKYIA